MSLDDAGMTMVLDLSDDGSLVDEIWIMGQSGDGSASPATEAGIRLGASTADLTAAYPGLETIVQRGSNTWVFATPDEGDDQVSFVVDDDLVTLIGAPGQADPPKEWCS
ncbi:hypothetical protein [Agromyces laixinhei]|nr:hypothetical protein [Agromyces laixinhei]